jgi:hypothetical protein
VGLDLYHSIHWSLGLWGGWKNSTLVAINTIHNWGSSKMDLITRDCMGQTKLVLVSVMRYAIHYYLPMINIKHQVVWVMNQFSKVSLTFGKRLFVQSLNSKSGMPWIVSKEIVQIVIWSCWIFSHRRSI